MLSPGPRIGIFGGTFDPVHVGHLVAATWAREALGLERVLLVVANVPWQKVGTRAVTPAEDRFLVVQAAVAGVAGVEACRIEIDRGGPSYSADTVRELLVSMPSAQPYVIVGADVAARARQLATGGRAAPRRDPGCRRPRRGGVGPGPSGLACRAPAHPGPRHLEQPAPEASGRGAARRFPDPRGCHTLHPSAKSVRWQQMSSPEVVRTAVGPSVPGGLTEVDVAVPAA